MFISAFGTLTEFIKAVFPSQGAGQGVVAAAGRNTVSQLVEQVMVGQWASQLTRSMVAASSGALAHLIEAVTEGQPASQPQLGQASKLVYLIVLSQLVGPPPARHIIGLVTVDEISHFSFSGAFLLQPS